MQAGIQGNLHIATIPKNVLLKLSKIATLVNNVLLKMKGINTMCQCNARHIR